MKSLLNPRLQQESRLEAIRDGIVYYLKDSAFDFDEKEVKSKLSDIQDESRLLRLQKIAIQTDDIQKFLERIR